MDLRGVIAHIENEVDDKKRLESYYKILYNLKVQHSRMEFQDCGDDELDMVGHVVHSSIQDVIQLGIDKIDGMIETNLKIIRNG